MISYRKVMPVVLYASRNHIYCVLYGYHAVFATLIDVILNYALGISIF